MASFLLAQLHFFLWADIVSQLFWNPFCWRLYFLLCLHRWRFTYRVREPRRNRETHLGLPEKGNRYDKKGFLILKFIDSEVSLKNRKKAWINDALKNKNKTKKNPHRNRSCSGFFFWWKLKCEPLEDRIFHRSAAAIFLFFYSNKGGESVLSTS